MVVRSKRPISGSKPYPRKLAFLSTPKPDAPCFPQFAALLLLALVVGAAYSTGRHSARLEVAGCAGLAEPKLPGDTVAPEGEPALWHSMLYAPTEQPMPSPPGSTVDVDA